MKYKCTVCGHIYDEEKEGVKFEDLPADWKCPLCKQPKSRFEPIDETANMVWASEHTIGIAADLDEDMKEFLRAEFAGECSEVGMYLAMSRAAIREGYPEIGAFYRQAARFSFSSSGRSTVITPLSMVIFIDWLVIRQNNTAASVRVTGAAVFVT